MSTIFDDENVLHKGLVPPQKALGLVLKDATSIDVESVDLLHCNGRVLAEDISAQRTQPPFDASAMDGYAVRQADVTATPCDLKIIGQSAAGHAFQGRIKKGEAVRIFTGAPIPLGADTIIIQENTKAPPQEKGRGIGFHICVLSAEAKGKFIRPAGLDFSEGQVLLNKDQVLNPQSISLAASMNHASLPVFKKPNVAILATGDELVLPGSTLEASQIIASNTYGIAAIAKEAGANVLNLGIANDTFDDLKNIISDAINNGSDLIVTSGGASVGDHDLVKPVMESLGFVFSFIKIAMKPGKPVIFGRTIIDGKERRFLGLAGNPVSSLVSSHIFLKPLIQLLAGKPPEFVKQIEATITQPLEANGDREDYMRGFATRMPNGKIETEAFTKQDSSMLATLNRANCLIIRQVDAKKLNIGDKTPIILLQNI